MGLNSLRLLVIYFNLSLTPLVGAPGIEPGPRGPKPRTLPLCYAPTKKISIELKESLKPSV
jgi:hypothetical protein